MRVELGRIAKSLLLVLDLLCPVDSSERVFAYLLVTFVQLLVQSALSLDLFLDIRLVYLSAQRQHLIFVNLPFTDEAHLLVKLLLQVATHHLHLLSIVLQHLFLPIGAFALLVKFFIELSVLLQNEVLFLSVVIGVEILSQVLSQLDLGLFLQILLVGDADEEFFVSKFFSNLVAKV